MTAIASLLKTQPQPFRFLLYTEWIMLGSCGVMAAIEAWQRQSIPVQHITILIALGFMGWILPAGKTPVRYFYTAIEMGLIFYGTTLGYLHILPTLYLIVLIRSCFLFDAPGRWIVAALSLLMYLVHQFQYLQRVMPLMLPNVEQQQIWMHQTAELLMFALGLFFVSQLVSTLLAERRTQEQLAQAHAQLREYALQIEDLAALQERNRIAREIHDSLGHALTALNIQLQTAVKLWQHDPMEAQPFLEQAHRLGKVAMKEVRQSVNALRADAEEEESLEQQIASLMENFRQSTGITVASNICLEVMLPPTVAKTLYRIVQEALTNICKYAQATEVRLQLQTTGDRVDLSIEDNGRGFQVESRASGFGLQGMRERIASLNGEFHLETSPEAGCRIDVSLPLSR
ncbi:MAG: sensor histidine kinase [Oscillatoriaceae cyanobacterium Prado104]|jgi:signal transduction histidine kinase|nr:sensor histidine kinase [Oscillatoriaceae cyanobacterium Prado104]